MRRAFASILCVLVLTGCSGTDELEEAGSSVGLKSGDTGQDEVTETPEVDLPEAPIDTLEKDLSTPEGAARAYMNYLQLGDGGQVCALFTPAALDRFYTSRTECSSLVREYSASVRVTFEDALAVADNLILNVEKKTSTEAKVGIAVKANEAQNVVYYDELTLQRVGDEWAVVSALSLVPPEQEQD